MNKIQMVAKLYDARGSLKALFPDKFEQRISEIQTAIKMIIKQSGESELEVMIKLMKEQKEKPILQMWIMAATVELLEPS
jgi:hypothetical protein